MLKRKINIFEAACSGDKEAFGLIVGQYQSLICAITYNATGDICLSEDIAQETFLTAWNKLRELRDPNKLRPWLCGIARNIVKEVIRRHKSDIIEQSIPLEFNHEKISAMSEPQEYVISKEEQKLLWQNLERIPDNYREPMILFYREQQSIKTVAELLDLSEDAVKQRLSRGRKMLKKQVAAFIEQALGNTGPQKAFTIAVVAALPSITPKTATAGVATVIGKGATAAKTSLLTSFSNIVLGPLLGLLGGIIGSWASIVNTKSPRERKFMIKMCIVVCSAVLLLIYLPVMLAIAKLIPRWLYWFPFVAFFVFIWPLMIWGNVRQRQIQMEDGTYVKPKCQPIGMTKAKVYSALGGSIFGSICWLLLMSFTTKDWFITLVVLAFAFLLFAISTRICFHTPGKYWQIVIADLVGIGLFSLAVVNLRWEKWMQFYHHTLSHQHSSNMPLWAINLGILFICTCLFIIFLAIKRKQYASGENTKEDS